MMTALYRLHCSLEPNSLTIKFHAFYNHMSTHTLKFGYKHTSEVFEREHKNLMNSVHHQSTNCEQSIIVKYACGQIAGNLLETVKDGLTQRNDYTSCMKSERDRLPELNDSSNVLNYSLLNSTQKETSRFEPPAGGSTSWLSLTVSYLS
ncbi:hypothetical protein B9Z55_020930 [Caenorhabditis nigoni]|uniref:Uncharacterized protein n=1 Tax=Caenorhabditis nigoni TaxID=1611254 RepID=A0A2G5TPY4_9PELO|nr:hypothetical protein B9Z55_020930 [Caenorhabditis nigoni]